MGLLPRAFDEDPEPRRRVPGRCRLVPGARLRRQGVAFAAGLLDGLESDGAKGDLAGPARGPEEVDPTTSAGRPDPDAETANPAVPDRILPVAGAKAGDRGVGEPRAVSGRHGSAPEHRADRLGGVFHHGVGKMRVFERRLGPAVSEQPADREHGFALSQGEAGMRVAYMM